jgi:hypothetical protein
MKKKKVKEVFNYAEGLAKVPEYRMYVDEVGNPGLGGTSDPNQRFFSLTGVILSLETGRKQLYPKFEELKSQFFDSHPDDPVVFHRKEIINAKPPFEALKKQYIREQFDEALLRIISETDFTVITVVLDKHKEFRYDPYHYCMSVLLERYVLYLDKKGLNGDVLAESREKKENMRLKKEFRKLYENGTQYITPAKISNVLTSREIKIKLKINNIAGVQLADLLAHPSRREILLEKKTIKDLRKNIFAERIVDILKVKYDMQDGEIYGAGKNFLP